MHSNSKAIETLNRRRTLALFVVFLMIVSLAPTNPAQGDAEGYLVFRDTVPVGPDLDVEFHAVIPEGVIVLGSELHLYGSQGVLPVAAASTMDGVHDHSMSDAGSHSHGLASSAGHEHTVTPSGGHDHTVTVYNSHVDVDPERMAVNLPSHTHTFNGATRLIDPYDFSAVTSNGHDHTVPAHSHNTLISQSGTHQHVTDLGGDHVHDVNDVGEHAHVANVATGHNHSLQPGWSPVEDGVRPSDVEVSITSDLSTSDIPGTHGVSDEDWTVTIDLDGELAPGISKFTLTSASHGMLEYVLVVEIDKPYGVISGQGAIGPGGELQVPIWSPPTSLSATAYLFGDDLAMVGTMVDVAGNHTHVAEAAGEHDHPLQPSVNHTHVVGGGDHEHEGYAATSTPATTSATPLWDLSNHRHDLTWNGATLTSVGSYNYGNTRSENHDHQVLDHDHFVTLNVSGDHGHNFTTEDVHTHVDGVEGVHSHGTTMSADHSHAIVFMPTDTTTAGPTGVTAKVDEVDITTGSGGPWNLTGTASVLDLGITVWSIPHSLSIASATEGGIEWVVLIRLSVPLVMVFAHGTVGNMMVHLPTPAVTGGAKVGVMGDQYVMPLTDVTTDGGDHGHISSAAGVHSHDMSEAGNHSHDLDIGGIHIHDLVLNDTVVDVLDANGTVDLPPHTHTAPLGSQTTTANGIGGATGTHLHQTTPHDHELNWTQGSNHVHLASLAGNHSHVVTDNGSHVHSLEGGEHGHALLPGVGYHPSYSPPTDVDVLLGTHSGVRLDGGPFSWWEEFNVGGGHLSGSSMEVLTASSGQVGTLTVVVWFLLDSTAPEPVLLDSPDWVKPGDTFQLTVGVPEDIEPSTAALVIGPVVVDGMEHNATSFTIVFTCTVPDGATEGQYNIDVTASDNVGNVGTTTVGTLGIDGTPPMVTVTLDDPMVEDQGFTWVTSGTPVNMTVEDATSGPDLLEFAFAEDGPWQSYDPADGTLFDGQPEGDATLYYRGADNAGNWAGTQSIDVKIDDSGPEVLIRLLPSSPSEGPEDVIVSPDSIISFFDDDGDGSGTDTLFYQIEGARLEPTREYDRPFPVSSIEVGIVPTFTITWYAWDRLGNVEDGSNELSVKIDPVPPIPSPQGDLFLPTHVTESPFTLQGRIPGNVARFLYRIDGSTGGVVDVTPDSTFDFIVDLDEGPNTLLYALESPVGETSEWVVGGVIHLDTEPPELVAVEPPKGTKDLGTKGLNLGLHFSEAVSITYVSVKVNGESKEVEMITHPGRASATIRMAKDLPGNALVQVQVTFEDLAGHEVDEEWSYKTQTPAAASNLTGVIIGLIAGFILGLMIMFFVTFKRKDPETVVHEGGVLTKSIISPDEDMSWQEDDEEVDDDDLDEDEIEPEDDGEPVDDEVDEDGEDVEEEQVEPEDEAEMDVPDDWEEGDVPEEEPEPDTPEEEPEPDTTEEEPEPDTPEDSKDLEDEIDRLLEEAITDDEPTTEDLPDPDGQTVDPGSRF